MKVRCLVGDTVAAGDAARTIPQPRLPNLER